MALEDKGAQHHGEVVDKFVSPRANYEMTTRDYVVRPYATHSVGSMTLTLPPVAEAKGRFYSIIARQATAAHTITIHDRDDSECWPGDIVMDGKCDRALLYSDGLSWYSLTKPGVWPGVSGTPIPGHTHTPTTIYN